ncbi:MAG: HDOD domain-containing protein, partial [Pseudomonadota bacterium]|nr:HDOD domain-containing protein [Pseudomonadota bacterium]
MTTLDTTLPTAADALALLWARVRERGELPGFSKVVNAIVGAMRGDDDREFNMTRTVLSDPALTQKVLRLANSPMYAAFGQNITTVSRAVAVLGTESIGHLALGLKLIDGLSGASSASAPARLEMDNAVMAGHIGRQVAALGSSRDAEEAVVCAMLHALGRVMTSYYLPERWLEIRALSVRDSIDDGSAARRVLGLGLDDLGRAVAQQWGLPAALVDTVPDVIPAVRHDPLERGEWLGAVATLSMRCAEVIGKGAPAAVMDSITGEFAAMLGLQPEMLSKAVDTARDALRDEQAPQLATRAGETTGVRQPVGARGRPSDATQRLVRGATEIEQLDVSISTVQAVSMALETLYEGLGFSRAAVFQRLPREKRYVARMCLGPGMHEKAALLAFDDLYQPDVFHAALSNDKMVLIDDAHQSAMAVKLPRWWKSALPTARSFVVIPLIVHRSPAGFLYGDWDVALPPAILEPGDVQALDTIRKSLIR